MGRSDTAEPVSSTEPATTRRGASSGTKINPASRPRSGHRGRCSAVQDGPDGGGADLVAEASEFAVDAAVAPRGVLGGQLEYLEQVEATFERGLQYSDRCGQPGEAATCMTSAM